MKFDIKDLFIVFLMDKLVRSIPISDAHDVHGNKCLDNFTLTSNTYSRLLELQTKSVLYGPLFGNLLPEKKNNSSSNEKLFGFDSSMCCKKKNKACKRGQKKHIQQIYGKDKKSNPHVGALQFRNAVCQMKFETDTDVNRIPVSITHVKCSCDLPLYLRPKGHACVPVEQYITVFTRREGCDNGMVSYKESVEKVSVACVLVKKSKPKQKKREKIRMPE